MVSNDNDYGRLHSVNVLESNRQYIKQYILDLKSKGVRNTTRINAVENLIFVSKLLNKDLKQLTHADIIQFDFDIDNYVRVSPKKKGGKQGALSASTKKTRKTALKAILNFMGEKELAKWVSIKPCYTNRTIESILTDSDFEQMLEYTKNFKEASLLYVLYESGARISELATCTIGSLAFAGDMQTVSLTLTGKTGTRTISLQQSVPYIRKWLTQHPYNGISDKPLWVSDRHNKNGEYTEMRVATIRSILVRLAKQANIRKPVNPHSFRHARATRLASHFNDQQLKKYMGWAKNSNMAQTYCHLAEKDIEDAVKRMNRDATPCKYCSSCGCKLSFDANFCSACGKPQL